MTFEQWKTSDPKLFDVFLRTADGDEDRVRRSYAIAERRRAEWLALEDLCGKQLFIIHAMERGDSVQPWHRALALAIGRAAPSKGKLR
jgi:hypothetical protein